MKSKKKVVVKGTVATGIARQVKVFRRFLHGDCLFFQRVLAMAFQFSANLSLSRLCLLEESLENQIKRMKKLNTF